MLGICEVAGATYDCTNLTGAEALDFQAEDGGAALHCSGPGDASPPCIQGAACTVTVYSYPGSPTAIDQLTGVCANR